MLAELKRTDLESINETLAFTCNWQAEFPRKLEADIHSNLKRRVTVEQWTVWLNDLVRKGVNFPMVWSSGDVLFCELNLTPTIQLHEPCNVVYVEKSAKLFIGQFSYFTSQLMRDIAMRGAPVTGMT